MPLYDFVCPLGHVHERFFKSRGVLADEVQCGCGETATRKKFGRVSFGGPMWSELDALSSRYGRPIRDHRDVKAWEKEHNVVRMGDYDAKVKNEEEGHIHDRIRKTAKTEGSEAALAVVRETNMCESLGWSQEKYKQWKERDDESSRIAADPRVAPLISSDG